MPRLLLAIALFACCIERVVAADSQTFRPETLDQPFMPTPADLPSPRGPSGAPPGSVQVNVDPNGLNIIGDAANEPSIAIDPTNPQRMAVGWRQFDTIASNFRQAGYAYTTNGGATWTVPGPLTPGVFRSDPVLGADNAGTFFYNSLQSNFCIDVFKSLDGGSTWPTSVAAFGGDKAWMDIDRTAGPGAGFIYMAWQTGALCSSVTAGRQFTRSTDHGATWMSPISIPNAPRFGVTAVGPDGAVYVTGVTASSSTIVVAKSTDAQNGGAAPTWAFSVTGNFLGGAQVLGGGPNPGGLSGQVAIAASPLNAAHVYLLCSVNPPGNDPLDVMFSRSIDGGQTWSAPVRVNDDSTTNGAWQWFGTMSVAPNGRIDVVWNDTRDDPLANFSKTRYSYSLDEGVTWSPSYAFTTAWNSHVGYPNQSKIGDYYHMISLNSSARLIYSATFNGEQDVYYTSIVPNDCNRNGIADNLDIANSTSNDCNSNGLPDECENDCNLDSIADVCQLAGNDCNANGVPDDCEPGHEDCNNNGTFDLCEGFVDCNGNGHWDACDIANGNSADCNGDGVPNECELPGAPPADACANAPFVTTGIAIGGTNALATTDAGSGDSCGASGRDVYYRYRPISTGTLNLSLCSGTAFDTVLSVHSACPATAANQLAGACNDDGCGAGGGPSIINNIAVTAGQTYLIRVAGFDNASGGDVGNYVLAMNGPVGVGDCDNDGIPDACEIAAGEDANGNGIPDSCEPFPACATCAGDLTGDGLVNGSDVSAFTQCRLAFPTVLPTCGCSDMNGNHQVNSVDVPLFVNKLLSGGCP